MQLLRALLLGEHCLNYPLDEPLKVLLRETSVLL